MPEEISQLVVTAIVVAGGSSRRMGFDKIFASLAGKPVLAHAVDAFERASEIDEIVIVGRSERLPDIRRVVKAEHFSKVHKIVDGGAERHQSVWNGLQSVDPRTEFIAIHDGARPLTTHKMIHDCLELARRQGAACCASPIPDTVKRVADDSTVAASVDRSGLWAMQTPQIFRRDLIVQAYAALLETGEMVTDEVSAVQKVGKKIALLRNDDWNIKITFPRDLELAEHVLSTRGKQNV